MNRLTSRLRGGGITLQTPAGRVEVTMRERRTPDHYMGRHGGGWQWALGVHAGTIRRGRPVTAIIYLLTTSLRVTYTPTTTED